MKNITRDFTDVNPLEPGTILLSDYGQKKFYLAKEDEYRLANYGDAIECEILFPRLNNSVVKFFRNEPKKLVRVNRSELEVVILSLKGTVN